MDKDKARELSDILIAYAEGKTIQRELSRGSWLDVADLKGEDIKQATIKIMGDYNNLRIKPTPKLAPFTFEDRQYFKNLWFKSKSNETLNSLVQITDHDVVMNYGVKSVRINYKDLLNDFTFEDDSPCGKYINE